MMRDVTVVLSVGSSSLNFAVYPKKGTTRPEIWGGN